MDQKVYDTYVSILKSELVPALGCTEPIAIAYASAKARDVLGEMPERLELCNLGKAFPAQGTVEELYREFGLDAESLAKKAAEVLQ